MNQSVIIDVDQLKQKCSEWQKILRLQDWDVRVSVERASDMKLKHVNGECEWVLQTKQAHIRILDPIDYPQDTGWPQDMEQVLIHELLHLHFAPFDAFENNTHEHTSMEQAIDMIAGALLSLKRGGEGYKVDVGHHEKFDFTSPGVKLSGVQGPATVIFVGDQFIK